MAKSKSKRKTRSDKFPLTLHKMGQFCKKIKGKLYYFGTDKQKALQQYLEQATYLHAGKAPTPRSRKVQKLAWFSPTCPRVTLVKMA